MNAKQNSLAAVAMIVIGGLMLLMGGAAEMFLQIAVFAIGIALVVLGVIDLLQKKWAEGAIKAIIGLVVFLLAYLKPEIFMYVLSAVLILYGAYLVYGVIKAQPKGALNWVLALLMPVLIVVAGILLFFASEVVMTILASVLIVAGWLVIINDYVINK
ncbi:MAG: hypothetical protein IKV69_00890 [Clostridia bacterium]|jgi:hypothetical protein|nr:hypothetical protein [Clostridia bacterium]